MGCCISSAQNSHNPHPNSHHFHTSDTTHLTMEEEVVVKEVVLSETPKIPNPTLPDSPPLMDGPLPSSPQSSVDPKGSEKEEEIDEMELSVSGVSDFFSFSAIDELLSTSTATTRREKHEEEEEDVVGPPAYDLRKKSFSGDFSDGRVVRTRSPEKKSSLVAPARGNVGSPQIRRGRAEAARRRPNLPATRRVSDGERRGVGKGVTMKTGAPRCRSMDASAVKSRRVVEEPCDAVSGALLESLENPLVSLECFIFL